MGVHSPPEFSPIYRDDLISLTGYTVEDVDDHLGGEDEETARQFGWWPLRSTRETVLRAFRDWQISWGCGGPVQTFAVRIETTGELLGGCQLRKQSGGDGQVSYWIAARHRGRGLAQRALRLLCLHALNEAVNPLEAHVSTTNPASQAVAIAVGFAPHDRFEDEGRTMIRFVLNQPLPPFGT